MKLLMSFSLALAAMASAAPAQTNATAGEAAVEEVVSWRDFLLFDADSLSFPMEKRGDLSQCEGQNYAGMLRAVRECWPVFESFRDTKAFRHARAKAVELINDPDTDIDVLDQAQDDLLKEALLVSKLLPEPRYPAQYELAYLAHSARFKQWSRTRQFQRALDDANQLIGALHNGKAFRETGLHNGILHYSRVEMTSAIQRPAADSFIDRPAHARSITFADIQFVFQGAFYDMAETPPKILPLGVDPAREMRPGDCNGRDFAGLLRALRYCEPVLKLFELTRSSDLIDFPLQPDKFDKIAAKRILTRAERIDAPAADFFALIALTFQSGDAYVAGNNADGAAALARAQRLVEQSELDWDDDVVATLDKLPAMVEEALAKQAAAKEKPLESQSD